MLRPMRVFAFARASTIGTLDAASVQPESVGVRVDRRTELRSHCEDRCANNLLEEAFAVASRPQIGAQVGLPEQALGLWADAEPRRVRPLGASSVPWLGGRRGAIASVSC